MAKGELSIFMCRTGEDWTATWQRDWTGQCDRLVQCSLRWEAIRTCGLASLWSLCAAFFFFSERQDRSPQDWGTSGTKQKGRNSLLGSMTGCREEFCFLWSSLGTTNFASHDLVCRSTENRRGAERPCFWCLPMSFCKVLGTPNFYPLKYCVLSPGLEESQTELDQKETYW